MVVSYYSAPAPAQARGMKDMGVVYAPAAQFAGRAEKPGEWLEYSPLLTIVTLRTRIRVLAREVATAGVGYCSI